MEIPNNWVKFRMDFIIFFIDGKNHGRRASVRYFDKQTETFFCSLPNNQTRRGEVLRIRMEDTKSILFNNETYNIPQQRAKFLIGFTNYMRSFPRQELQNRPPRTIHNNLNQQRRRTCACCGRNLLPKQINNSEDFVTIWNGEQHLNLYNRIRELRYQVSRDFKKIFGDPGQRLLIPLSLRIMYKHLLDAMGPTVRRVTPSE